MTTPQQPVKYACPEFADLVRSVPADDDLAVPAASEAGWLRFSVIAEPSPSVDEAGV